MDQEMTFSLSYEQLTRFAERRIRECNLDSQGAIYLCESAKADVSGLPWGFCGASRRQHLSAVME
uniref:hypothetical protein n=1 Tax=Escherichia coli TaxID=562 RepID=UPI002355D4E6|nr:hypothetical protein [Escherichia coli]